jgi:hypothetical protein
MATSHDALEQILNEAIACDADRLGSDAKESEGLLAAARSAVSDTEAAIEANHDSVNVRSISDTKITGEETKRRAIYDKTAFLGTYKRSHLEEATLRLTADAEHKVRLAAIDYGLSLVPGLENARTKATLEVLKASKQWVHCQGLVEAKRAHSLFLPILENDPGATIDLKSSKTAAYALKELEFDRLISEFHSTHLN